MNVKLLAIAIIATFSFASFSSAEELNNNNDIQDNAILAWAKMVKLERECLSRYMRYSSGQKIAQCGYLSERVDVFAERIFNGKK